MSSGAMSTHGNFRCVENFIRNVIKAQFLFPAFSEDDNMLPLIAIVGDRTFYSETGRTEVDIKCFGTRKITPGKTEIIDGIKQISFSSPIPATYPHDSFVKRE